MENEFLSKAYNLLNTPRADMTVQIRCNAQRTIREALKYTMTETDRDNMEYHLNQFENDIYEIVSRENQKVDAEIRVAMAHLDKAVKLLEAK